MTPGGISNTMSAERNDMYKYIINNIIPADDLHWCEEEQKYVSLARDEVDEIVAACLNQGISELKDIMKVISWCGNIRIGNVLWKNFLYGSVDITGFEGEEPRFGPSKEKENED